MTQLALDLVVPIVCAGCGEGIDGDNEVLDAETCSACYVNTDCPAQCNAQHDAPSFRQANGSDWTCPDTGDTFWYEGPNRLELRESRGEWVDYETVQVGGSRGDWIDRDDACYCESCDGYIHSDNYGGDDLCQSCYDSRYGHEDCDCEDCCDELCGEPQNAGCNYCTAPTTHWHPITEEVSCATHAHAEAELLPQLVAA